jgi:hypothetical protein
MEGWALIVAAVAINYGNHKRGRATICSVSRTLPRPILLTAYTAGAVSLGVHVARGYRAILDP